MTAYKAAIKSSMQDMHKDAVSLPTQKSQTGCQSLQPNQ